MLQDMEFGGLKLTPKAYQVFRGNETVSGIFEKRDEPAEVRKKVVDLDYEEKLFNRLRKKRKELADKSGIPPYIVFSDRTLIEMSAYFPLNHNSMMSIHGVGEVKFEKYGWHFLDIICSYCEEHNIDEKQPDIKNTVVKQKS